jgi:protein tyrosine phosphatase (PTP) superfamily phosphohydrolase (DUF442 family)
MAFVACAVLSSSAAAAPPASGTDPVLARLGHVVNIAHPYPWLWTGGQPDAKALAVLAEAGVRDVFDIRLADEPRGLEEKSVVQSLGLRYLPIPTGPRDFTDSRFTAFRHHLIAHGPNHPMLIHCKSGNRVGAALLPWLVLDQGVPEEKALAMARGLGLTDPDITRRAQEYIKAQEALGTVR